MHKGPKGIQVDYADPRANFTRKEEGEMWMAGGGDEEQEEEYDSAESLEE